MMMFVRKVYDSRPIIVFIHCDSVRQRVLFNKIAVLAFQCLASQAPLYLADDCQLVSDARPCTSTPLAHHRFTVPFDKHGILKAIDALPLLDHGSGILCRPNCDNVTISKSQAIQTEFKDLFFRDMGARRSVTFS